MPIKLAYLIDDEEVDQRQYRRVINRSGVVEKIVSFNYADSALAALEAEPELDVDVIFLDINMPRMNGFEFLTAARERLGPAFEDTVVAMISTSLDPGDRHRAAQFDVVKDFINKPLTVEHVQKIAAMV